MATIEVLAPLRIETRFTAPDLAAGQPGWRLRLRVFPDEFSMLRAPRPPTPQELDRLDEALAATLPIDDAAAFGVLAAAVGAARAVWLMRTVPRKVLNGVPVAAREGAVARDDDKWPDTHGPTGLPPAIDVWLIPTAGAPRLVATLTPDSDKIAADMRLEALADEARLAVGDLPRVWWNSYARAVDVGLAIDVDLGPLAPDIDAIVVSGIGDTDPAQLVDAHAATGRLAVLAQGTPTNTVAGEATVELGRDARAWFPLVAADPSAQASTIAVVGALTGAAAATPLQGGDLDPIGSQHALTSALWDVLWGRAMRDVLGAGATEAAIATWARTHLAPEGPYPAIRVGEQPYGLLPASTLAHWVADPADPPGEAALRAWSMDWRKAAADAAQAAGTVVGAATDKLVAMLGQTTPSRRWGARPVAALAVARALRASAGLPTVSTTPWDDASASALGGQPRPTHPLALADDGFLWALPGEPHDRQEKADILRALATQPPRLLLEHQDPLGLLGHLLREAMFIARARIGLAHAQLSAGSAVDPDATLPLFAPDADTIALIQGGDDVNVAALRASADAGAREAATRFRRTQKSVLETIDRWEQDGDAVFATLLALLDTSNHRVDPWVTGLAHRRLQTLTAAGARFALGAYGWVDRPQPSSLAPGALPPGPTAAGLLHAPSYAQALTAALLRDAAIRDPADPRWSITIDSAKVRDAQRLAERVRLGVHPYEALGLEVERLVGDWNAVRELRKAFPLRVGHEGKRTCDGVRVLNAVLRGAEPLPAGMPAGLASTLEPLSHVLDTYGDLLVADGVHALVSGRGDLAQAAMEAAAGLGAPPELRAIRTPRQATTVRVSAWALLRPDRAPSDDPARAVDPAFGRLLDDELGPPSTWTWVVDAPAGPISVSLADRGLHGVALIDLSSDAVLRQLRGALPETSPVRSTGGSERLAAAVALAELLGGGDDQPSVPDVHSGRDDAKAQDRPLRQGMRSDLKARLVALRTLAINARATIAGTGAGDDKAVAAALAGLAPWRLGAVDSLDEADAMLAARLTKSAVAPEDINALRRMLRELAATPRLPVLPIVQRSTLPVLTAAASAADGRPSLDSQWLEMVAAVHPRLALLEAHQLDATRAPWPAATSGDPWAKVGPVVVAYGEGTRSGDAEVAIAGLDAWVDSVPSAQHATSAAFGFNGPKSRAPQAILLAVPPDPGHRLSPDELRDVVLETRELARARGARADDPSPARIATPGALVSLASHASFAEAWWPA